jgi:biopolymer transport protein ExbB/TolQ
MTKRTVALDCTRRASARSVTAVHGEMKRGLNSLATISSIAPFIGLFGTLLGIVNSFRGGIGEKTAALGRLAGYLSESLVPTELGLLVALAAFCGYRCLLTKLDAFDLEMENASIQLTSDLRSVNL